MPSVGTSRGACFAALCLAVACGPQPTTPSDDEAITFVNVTSGMGHTCGLTAAGMAYCWGGVDNGTATGQLTPLAVVMPAGVTFTSMSAGGYHNCGLNPAGTAYCWGRSPMPVLLPTVVGFASIRDGVSHTCGVTTTVAAHCWGDNVYGQLGDGTTTARLNPMPVAIPAGVSFTSLDVGWIHSCGLTPAGAVFCWGDNSYGQVGDGTTTNRLSPTAVTVPAGVSFASLAVGILHTCGLTPAGILYCWGANHRGRVGDGTMTDRLTPVPVAMPPGVTFTSVSAGYAHTCAATPAGAVYCWGRNVFGELGDGTTTNRDTPTAVVMPAGVTFTSLDVGYVHTCALTPAGAAFCWGNNDEGRLGDGTTTNRLTPTKVVPP